MTDPSVSFFFPFASLPLWDPSDGVESEYGIPIKRSPSFLSPLLLLCCPVLPLRLLRFRLNLNRLGGVITSLKLSRWAVSLGETRFFSWCSKDRRPAGGCSFVVVVVVAVVAGSWGSPAKKLVPAMTAIASRSRSVMRRERSLLRLESSAFFVLSMIISVMISSRALTSRS